MGLIKDWARSRRMSDPVPGTLRVSACTSCDPTATSMNYNLDGVISADGVLPTAVNHSGVAKARKWPSAGRELPVTVDRADPTSFRIEWDDVKTGDELGAEAAQALAQRMRGGGADPVAPAPGTTKFDMEGAPTFSSQVVDLRGTGAREQILAAMGNPEQLQATIMQSLADAGIQVPQAGQMSAGFPQPTPATVAAAAPEDPATRLRKLDGLKQQGLVDDTEYARLRAQILQDV